MKASTKKFELKYLRTRNAIERKGIRLVNAALKAQYADFMNRVDNLPPQLWKDQVNRISEQPIQHFFEQFYPMSATLGQMTRKQMISQREKKAIESEDELYLSTYQTYLQNLVKTSIYSERIKTITNTTSERINSVLTEVLTEAELNGYGVDKTRKLLSDMIGSNIRGNVRARAKAIAQTEIISASNQASTYAADSTGLEYRKYWSTSHLQNIRASHIQAEQDSIQRGGLRKDERFANGMLYPGDPAGSADEVINCRCSILHEII